MIELFTTVLLDTPAFHVLLRNSAFITIGVLAGQLATAIPAAWALAQFSFPGRSALFFAYILLMMLPFQAVMLPTYLVLEALNINSSLWAVILPGVFSAFPVFIMTQFFASIPRSLIDAARLDGAGEWFIFLHIGIPLGTPGIFAALVLGFFEYWNAVEQPLAFLEDPSLWPLGMLSPAVTAESAGLMVVAAALAAVPGLLVFLWGKGHLEAGIASTTRMGH